MLRQSTITASCCREQKERKEALKRAKVYSMPANVIAAHHACRALASSASLPQPVVPSQVFLAARGCHGSDFNSVQEGPGGSGEKAAQNQYKCDPPIRRKRTRSCKHPHLSLVTAAWLLMPQHPMSCSE